MEDKEIDKERLIIKEEWRSRNGAQQRFWEKQLPVIFEGSRYADRLPIGKMDIVENFKYKTIRDYYHKWYRPDLQAIIIVGDIDADAVEKQVVTLFSKIPMPANAAERVYYTVPDNKGVIFSILSDPEENKTTIYHYIKHDPISEKVKHTQDGYAEATVINLAGTMLSERLSEISKKADSPFLSAYAYDSYFFVSKTKNAWTTAITSKEGQEKEAFELVLTETERAKKYGFTKSELDRAKSNLMKMYEATYNNRLTQSNDAYIDEYVRSFLEGEATPGIEYEYEMIQRILPAIDTETVNAKLAQLLISDNNIVTVTGPEKEGYSLPSENDLRNVFALVQTKAIEPYVEKEVADNLMGDKPLKGKVISEKHDKILGVTTWELSNGMKVLLKPTEFKKDEILMGSIGYGGRSWTEDNESLEAAFIQFVPIWGGIGDFSSSDLKKVLAGKNANLNASIGNWTQGTSGSSSVKDIETLLQLNYLYFTKPRADYDVFSNFQKMLIDRFTNLEQDPAFGFQQQVTYSKYGNNPRMQNITTSDIKSLNYEKIIELYTMLFASPGSFTFSFTGNIDLKVLKPLVETYLASLPSGNKDAMYNKVNIGTRTGKYEVTYEEQMMNPKSKVFINYSGNTDYNLKNQIAMSVLNQILDIVYVRTIREDEGGTYGVGVSAYVNRIPKNESAITMTFDTNPEQVKRLTGLIHKGIEAIAENGPEKDDFSKVRAYMLKQFDEDIRTNSYWLSTISSLGFYDDDSHSAFKKTLEELSINDIKSIASELINQNNLIEVIQNPITQ